MTQKWDNLIEAPRFDVRVPRKQAARRSMQAVRPQRSTMCRAAKRRRLLSVLPRAARYQIIACHPAPPPPENPTQIPFDMWVHFREAPYTFESSIVPWTGSPLCPQTNESEEKRGHSQACWRVANLALIFSFPLGLCAAWAEEAQTRARVDGIRNPSRPAGQGTPFWARSHLPGARDWDLGGHPGAR